MSVRFASPEELVSSQRCQLGVSGWIRITQEDVDRFAAATRAHEWIHVDVERARREGPFGTTVAHGYLTLSLGTAFITELLLVEGLSLGVNYGLERVRFPAPVPVDTRVRATGTLVQATRHGDGVRTLTELVYEAEGQTKPPCVAQVVSLLLP